MPKCAYRFGAPDAAMMVHTATPVLHDGRMRCLAPCLGRQPAETGGHFPHATAWGKRERERGGGGRERVRWVADLKLPHMVGRSSTMPGRGACPLLEDGAGLRRRGHHGRELQGLETARMCLLRSLRGRGRSYIVRHGKRRCRTLLGCRVTKAGWCRRRGGPGDCTAARSGGTACNADRQDWLAPWMN